MDSYHEVDPQAEPSVLQAAIVVDEDLKPRLVEPFSGDCISGTYHSSFQAPLMGRSGERISYGAGQSQCRVN